jgi:hypothetical protein
VGGVSTLHATHATTTNRLLTEAKPENAKSHLFLHCAESVVFCVHAVILAMATRITQLVLVLRVVFFSTMVADGIWYVIPSDMSRKRKVSEKKLHQAKKLKS